MEQINHANGEAAAMIAVAEAKANGLNIVSKILLSQVYLSLIFHSKCLLLDNAML